MIGKVGPGDLGAYVFERTGVDDGSVVTGPGYGEDAAAIRIGEELLVVSSDPLSLAVERIGTLGVHVAANDVAAAGGDPRWLTVVIFLHDDDEAVLDAVTGQLHDAATDLGVSIVGGHSEYVPDRSRPLLSLTAMGTAESFVSTAGARPGDAVILAGGAGIEGTAILATDFRSELAGVADDVLDRAAALFGEISVVDAARTLRGHATAMHDPTEGGVLTGLVEMAVAAGVELKVDADAVPVREETRIVCEAMGVDPLRIFGSGGLLATVPPDAVDSVLADLGEHAAAVGRVEEADEPGVRLDGAAIRDPVRDELYDLWE